MQKIIHNYVNQFEVLNQVEKAYYLLSQKKQSDEIISDIFNPLIALFVKYAYIGEPRTEGIRFDKITYPVEGDTYIVCTSGGKDSIAVAKKLKDEGKNVILYHMHGINRAYSDEVTVIESLADRLGVEYYIERVRLEGTHQYVEHPMKNMLIANGAINYCICNKLPLNIVFGNYQSSKLEDMEFEICGGDSRDMWDVYENIIQSKIEDFHIYTPLNDISDTYKILDNDLDLIYNCISCMTPMRFRGSVRRQVMNNYNITLPPHRCGSCAKCCLEYIYLADQNVEEFDEGYYRHCFSILRDTAVKETGNKEIFDKEVWDRYFWYDISESHMEKYICH